MALRVLAGLGGSLLVAFPGTLALVNLPLPLFFLILISYGAVWLGMRIRWRQARKINRTMTATAMLGAGMFGIVTIVPVIVLGLVLYDLSRTNLLAPVLVSGFHLLIIMLLSGLVVASGTALLVYGVREI